MAIWTMENTKAAVSENGSLLDAEYELAKEIGKRASDLIVCPDCEKQDGALIDQKLVAEGDNESRLFCPHCDLAFDIIIVNLPYPK